MKSAVILVKTLETLCPVSRRLFSSTVCCCGKKTREPFDKRFTISPKDVGPNKKGGNNALVQELGRRDDMPQIPGYYNQNGKFVFVKEMIPEFIVPDFRDSKLKPYVSYRVDEIEQSELTAKDIFSECYAKKIIDDYHDGKITLEEIKVKYSSKGR